jgi:hypothetical protein
LRDHLLRARKEGLDSNGYEDALGYVLKELYELVGRPVIQGLNELSVPEQSRVWWYPTSVFCSLPLHGMGPIPQVDGRPGLVRDISWICTSLRTPQRSLHSSKLIVQAQTLWKGLRSYSYHQMRLFQEHREKCELYRPAVFRWQHSARQRRLPLPFWSTSGITGSYILYAMEDLNQESHSTLRSNFTEAGAFRCSTLYDLGFLKLILRFCLLAIRRS